MVQKYEDCISSLDVQLHSAGEFWSRIQKFHPKVLVDEQNLQEYVELVECLQFFHVKAPVPLAPDGTGTLRFVNEIYDHCDWIFDAAFRQESAQRFLHPKAQKMRAYWLSLGLRTGPSTGQISGEDYLQCVLAVDLQWTPNIWNTPFSQSAGVVAPFLEFEKPEFRTWSKSIWRDLSKARILPVQVDVTDQWQYRQPRMRQLSHEHTHCALNDAAQPSDVALSWSQMKRLERAPAPGVFALRPQGARPTLTAVHEHVQFLVSICNDVSQSELSRYLEDIKACYDYLQEDCDATSSLPGIHDARIWLNVNTTETDLIQKTELLSNLLPAKLICLDATSKVFVSTPVINDS